MKFPWCNSRKLDTLQLKGEDSKLIFTTGKESVEVFFENFDIIKVICRVNGVENLIENKDAHHVVVGEGNAQRDVYHYLKPGGPTPQLRLGITKHRGLGTWSSLPHSFELNPELGFEETFFYLLEGGSQRAIQVGEGVWFDGSTVNDIWFVKDRSFSTIPMGYHPVVGEPGVSVNYIWAYLAKKQSWEKI